MTMEKKKKKKSLSWSWRRTEREWEKKETISLINLIIITQTFYDKALELTDDEYLNINIYMHVNLYNILFIKFILILCLLPVPSSLISLLPVSMSVAWPGLACHRHVAPAHIAHRFPWRFRTFLCLHWFHMVLPFPFPFSVRVLLDFHCCCPVKHATLVSAFNSAILKRLHEFDGVCAAVARCALEENKFIFL